MLKKDLKGIAWDLKKIIDSEHADPHTFLGMHVIKNKIFVRAFFPQAQKLFIKNLDAKKKFEMKKINDAGVFEIIFNTQKTFDYKYEIIDYENNKYEIFDAYNFEPVLSDFDLYLFVV